MVRNKYKKIQIGIEVECILDKDKLGFIERGGYHRGIKLINSKNNKVEGWKVERDGSISSGISKLRSPEGTEFVSDVFTSKKDFFQGINRLIDTLSCGGKYELKEVMEVNKSCGCHIHLSKGKRNFHNKVHSFMYKKAKKDFFNRIKASTLPSKTKMAVLSQYYRPYAKESSKVQFRRNRSRDCGVRGSEWNFNSEFSGRGLEWRSFNIKDVETWKDFRLLMSIGFETVGNLLDALAGWKKGNLYRKEIEVNVEKVDERTIIRKKRKDITRIVKIKKHRDDKMIIYKKPNRIKIIPKKDKEVVVRKGLKDRLIRILESGEYV